MYHIKNRERSAAFRRQEYCLLYVGVFLLLVVSLVASVFNPLISLIGFGIVSVIAALFIIRRNKVDGVDSSVLQLILVVVLIAALFGCSGCEEPKRREGQTPVSEIIDARASGSFLIWVAVGAGATAIVVKKAYWSKRRSSTLA